MEDRPITLQIENEVKLNTETTEKTDSYPRAGPYTPDSPQSTRHTHHLPCLNPQEKKSSVIIEVPKTFRFSQKIVQAKCLGQNIISWLAITISVICLICVALFLSGVNSTQPTPTPDTCVRCADVSPTSDRNHVMLKNFRKKDDGKLCCLDNGDQFMQLIKVVSERERRRYKTTHPGLGSRPNATQTHARIIAAHVVLSDPRSSRGHNNYGRLMEWEDRTTPSYISSSGIDKFNGSHLVVLERGIYYIYSQVTFNIPESSDIKEVLHYIRRANNDYNARDILLKNEVECMDNGRRIYTSRLGGIMNLRPNDEVYVEVSNVEYVYRPTNSQGLSNFGLFKI